MQRWIHEIDQNCDSVARILGELCYRFCIKSKYHIELGSWISAFFMTLVQVFFMKCHIKWHMTSIWLSIVWFSIYNNSIEHSHSSFEPLHDMFILFTTTNVTAAAVAIYFLILSSSSQLLLLALQLNSHYFLVGNKDDDPDRKVVTTADLKKFAQQINIPSFETSAKENKNVEEVSVPTCNQK